MTSDTTLALAARDGDLQAFSELVTRYQRAVFSLCYRMLGGHVPDAEDAAQEAFLRAFRALGAYDPARSFSTWLLSITAHHCIDRIRRRPDNVVSLDALPPWRWKPADGPDPEAEAVRADESAHIARLLETLPEDYRLVIVLRYWHDLGYEEIAGVLGDTESAVKSRLHRARRQLAAAMAAESARPTAGQPAGDEPRSPARPAVKGGVQAWYALLPAS
jgi:RNA polymerase sigma-70 factor (ECF subfamily)